MKIWTLAVHPIDLRRHERSFHDGAAPSPNYPPVGPIPHVELTHTVRWSPLGAKFSEAVFGDATKLALLGHDSGIGLIHLSTPSDNLQLWLTMLTASCKWLFASTTVTTQEQAVVGFAPFAPYLGCHFPVSLPGTRWFPLQGTVILPLSLKDLLMGWLRVFATMGADAVAAAVGKTIGPNLEFIDDGTAARLGRRIAQETGALASEEFVKGMSVSVVFEGTVKFPFQLAEVQVFGGDVRLLGWTRHYSRNFDRDLYVMAPLEPEVGEAPSAEPISPSLSALVAGLPLLGDDD